VKKTGLCQTAVLGILMLLVSVVQAAPQGREDSAREEPSAGTARMPAQRLTFEPSRDVPSGFVVSPEIEVYGNFHTMGLIAALPADIRATDVRSMRSFINVNGQWRRQQDLVQVGNFPWFATSVFWLKPSSVYQFKVEVWGEAEAPIAVWFGEGATRAEPVLHSSTSELYVATNGDDGNPGTQDRPFRTVAKGLRTVAAGQTLILREGRYHEGHLQLTHSGSPEAPIVIRAASGEKVILDGTDPELSDLSTWTSDGTGMLRRVGSGGTRSVTLIRTSDDHAVRLFPVRELSHLRERAIPDVGRFVDQGIGGAVWSDGDSISMAASEPWDGFHLHISGSSRGLVLDSRSHVQIDGLEFCHYGGGESPCAIMLRNSSDTLIQNCRFRSNDAYIHTKLTSDRVTIQDCEFTDAILEWPFDYMKGASGISGRFETGAVTVDAQFHGRGLVFRRNRIRNLFDGVHLTPWIANTARTSEIDFYENVVEGCIDDFAEADGFSRNVRIFDNFMDRSLSGISVAQALDGPTFVLYNVIGNCGMVPAAQRAGSENAGYPFKTNGGTGADIGSGPLFFYHNTAFTLDPQSSALLVKNARWRNMTLRNNIWAGRRRGFELWMTSPSPIDFDYDNLFVQTPGAPLVLQGHRTKVLTLPEVRERYGWLKHGISADPLIRDVKGRDFSLRDTSPCIDAGVLIPGINDLRILGHAPDVGAFEAR
jgi:hypothetical protein